MRGNTRGFTLVELAVTLAVMAILLAAAMPSFAEQRSDHPAISDDGLVVGQGGSIRHAVGGGAYV